MAYSREWRNSMKSSNERISTGLMIQFCLLIVLIILVISSFIWKWLLPIADIIAGLMFFIIAYNKRDFYKKKYIILFLITFGLFFIGLGVFNFING